MIASGFYLSFGYSLALSPGPADTPLWEVPHKSDGPATIRVSISGEIESPGVYELLPSTTVAEAIHTAGGGTVMADLTRLNLGARLLDSSELKVPCREAGFHTPVSVNRSSVEELMTLPGVGPTLARRIVKHRELYGPYGTIAELLAIDGIGPKSLERIEPLVVLR